MQTLRDILVYLDICDGNMEEGSLRCDANVSVRPRGSDIFGTRAEIKNMNSFRFLQKALEYEIERQTDILESGGEVVLETRLFDSDRGVTSSMRGKEEAHDYRYFPEPDLAPLRVDQEWIDELSGRLPELRDVLIDRYVTDMGLPEYDAEVLTSDRLVADFFEAVINEGTKPKSASNWIMGEFMRLVKDRGIDSARISPEQVARIISLVEEATISSSAAKKVFEEVFTTGRDPDGVVKEKGLAQVSDEDAIRAEVKKILQNHPDEVAQFRGGKEKVLGFFVGQVMKATKGKANPGVVNKILRELLAE